MVVDDHDLDVDTRRRDNRVECLADHCGVVKERDDDADLWRCIRCCIAVRRRRDHFDVVGIAVTVGAASSIDRSLQRHLVMERAIHTSAEGGCWTEGGQQRNLLCPAQLRAVQRHRTSGSETS